MATVKPDLTRVWASGAPGANIEDPDTTSPGKFAAGWTAEIPPFENFNFLQQLFTQGLAYVNENGLGEWDTDTTYPIKGIVRGSDGNYYEALVEQNGNDPISDIVNWKLWFTDYSSMKAGRKNMIVDGVINYWYEGVSQTSSGYGSDTMYLNENSGTTKINTQEPLVLGVDLPEIPTARYVARTVVTSVAGSGNFCSKSQRIESVRTLSGTTATFSLYCKADSSKNIAIEFVQNFGTGGSPSSEITGIGVTTISVTNSLTRYEVTLNLPSISGKTLGSNLNDYLEIVIWMDAGSTYNSRTNSLGQQSGTFEFTCLQLEKGDRATSFEEIILVNQSPMVNRFYYKTEEDIYSNMSSLTVSSVNGNMLVPYPTEMRTTPVVTNSTFNNCTFNTNVVGLTYTQVFTTATSAVSGAFESSGKLFDARL